MKRIDHKLFCNDMLCICCGRFSDALLCPMCTQQLRTQSFAYRFKQKCPSCGRPLQDRAYPCPFCLEGIQAYSPYIGIVSTLLGQFKAGGEKVLSQLFVQLYMPMLASIARPVLLPVPASRRGVSDRGYDQMELIVSQLMKRTGYPSLRLFTQKGAGQSKFLSLAERKERHTLSLVPNDKMVAKYKQEGYAFVLLDDICTTGLTLTTCKRLLYEQYGIEATSLVIAMV